MNFIWWKKKEVAALTEREEEVINWVGYGNTNADIGLIPGDSSNTVKNHVYNASVKLFVNSVTELVSIGG
ncbi:DNA-binding CsgD family transcriptional regulator [Metapseudomonas resinovorans]|uniref:helix-turn-helix domain-containing protein n=1 Tax=Metapseudomonas resinovorans TaxID=53412 RepID=UPI003D1FEF4D